ncbi:MAG: translocation/assembly module TamB domain-containing protein, partial [Bacteroidota bacterium]
LSQPLDASKIAIKVDLLWENDELQVSGNYDVKMRQFNVSSEIKKLELSLLDPYLQKVMGESQGTLNGAFELKGSPETPRLNGFLNLNGVSTQIAFTKARYNIAQQKITFDERQFDLGDLRLTDPQNRKANVKGKILHDFFKDFAFDLAVVTDEFHFLNTTVEDNALFYGQLFLKADIKIKGPLESPLVDIAATTLSQSDLTLSPFSEAEVIFNEDYIVFGNPEQLKAQDTIKAIYEAKNIFPFDVNLNLALTDVANFNFVVDPLSGDQLSCRGNANLIVNFKPTGAIEMYGIYTVSSGQYKFSYGDFIQRTFQIQPGGTVVFNGDPLQSRFDLTAFRTTPATTYELIANEATISDTERVEAQKRQPVQVLLSIKGDLANPQIDFDIQLPDDEGTVVTSIVERKLETLRNEPNELNKQVFSLLLLNSFMSSSSLSPTLSSAGETAVLSSVSKLFSNQLNRLANKLIKGVEVSIDVNSYRSGFEEQQGNTSTEVGLGFSKKMFNDRLRVQATGNVDVTSSANTSEFSTLAGDFLLEYQLTANGNYLLKVFRKNSYDVFNESDNARNGISISMKKALEKKLGKKKK